MLDLNSNTKVELLLLAGGDDAQRVVQVGKNIIKYSGTTNIPKLLVNEPVHRLYASRKFLRALPIDFSSYRCVVNLITEAEGNARVLELLSKQLRNCSAKVVNHPDAVLQSTRDRIARRLQGIPGLRVPITIRLPAHRIKTSHQLLSKAGFDFPIILRQAGTHGGEIVGRFNTVEDTVAALKGGADHLAMEFVDFRSPDGLYRKYRVFFFGEERVLRHQIVSDDWNVHARDRTRFMAARPDLIAEERALFERHSEPFSADVSQTLDEVRKRMLLDFFGMDFGITPGGKVVLFEANAAMAFFPFSKEPEFRYLERSFDPARRAFRKLLGLPGQGAAVAAEHLERPDRP